QGVAQGPRFIRTESLFAGTVEDLWNRHARELFHAAVGIDEGKAHPLGDQPSDGRLSAPHEPEQDDVPRPRLAHGLHAPQLFQVAAVVPVDLGDAVSAELLEKGPGQFKGDDRLPTTTAAGTAQ